MTSLSWKSGFATALVLSGSIASANLRRDARDTEDLVWTEPYVGPMATQTDTGGALGESAGRAACPADVTLSGSPGTPAPLAGSDARAESIYLGTEFGCDGGTIVGLRYQNSGSLAGPYDVTIRLQQTSLTALPSDSFLNSGWTVCFSGSAMIGAGWSTFLFDSPFAYTTSGSTPNLLVDFSYSNSSPPNPAAVLNVYTTSGLRSLWMGCNNCTCGGSSNPLNWTTCSGCNRVAAAPVVRVMFGGACCHSDDTCAITAQADCTGTWLGVGSGCTPNPCLPCTDGTPPLVTVTGPSAFACVCSTVTVTGSVSDPDGTYIDDKLEYRRLDESAWTVAATGSGPRSGTLYTWDTGSLTEAYYYLRVTGRNACNLTSSDQTIMYIDRAFDTVDMRSPADGVIRGGVICFDGSAWDHCFANYTVMYKPVSGGSYAAVDPNHPTYTAAVLYDPLASWNAASVPDGNYLVRLRGATICGYTADVIHTVTIDNTPPVATLSGTLTCGTLHGTVPIVGTATDAHLAGWTLQYTGGNTHGWVTIASGAAPVNNAVLGSWNTTGLRACGYVLRLVVSDQAYFDCSSSTHVTEYFAGVQVGLTSFGDMNCDGVVDFNDIDPFVECLSGGPCECP